MPKPSLMPVEDALATVLAAASCRQSVETVALLQAAGRVLAVGYQSSIDVPPCANSAMDGYALRFSDTEQQKVFSVSQRIPAGVLGKPLEPGTVARIFTGAALPPGSDTVVMQEDTELQDNRIKLRDSVQLGQHVRPQGQDIARDSVVVAGGKRLQPQDIGLLASIGITEVSVYSRLKVAVLSTGDELVEPGQALAEGQIYNSNRYTLSALLLALGFDVIDGGIIADDFTKTCEHLKDLSGRADVVISSGGVSVGEEDHVKAAVEKLGQLNLWKLNIKPGKPLAFGRIGDTPFFGLPGNPSSVFVTFCLMARPYLLRAQGQQAVLPAITRAKAGFEWSRAGSRQEYLRAKVEGSTVELYPNQSSGVLASVSWANALVILPPATTVKKGDEVQLILLSDLVC